MTIDRNTAQYLNPFIGIHSMETIDNCNRAVSDLGYMVSSIAETGCDFDKSNLFRFFEAITIALRYEIQTMQTESGGVQ